MLFKEVVDIVDWGEVKPRLAELYPSQAKKHRRYKKVLDRLKNLKPKKSKQEMQLVINYVVEKECENWHDVSGYNEKEPLLFGLSFNEWEEWLGLEIQPETIQDYLPVDIVAYCMWEMTFWGLTQRRIRKTAKKLKLDLNNKK